MKYPTCKFEHLGETFDPSTPVEDDHPMVAERRDLFTNHPPKPKPRATAATTKQKE